METLSKAVLIILLATRFIGGGIFGGKDHKATNNAKVAKFYKNPALIVALLPFDNLSTDPNAATKFTSFLVNYLAASKALTIIEPSLINKTLVDLKVRSTTQIDADTATKLCQSLGCEAIFVGTITDYGEARLGQESFPVISMNMRLIDPKNTTIVWTYSTTSIGGSKGSLFKPTSVDPLGKITQSISEDIKKSFESKKDDIEVLIRGTVHNQQGIAKGNGTETPNNNNVNNNQTQVNNQTKTEDTGIKSVSNVVTNIPLVQNSNEQNQVTTDNSVKINFQIKDLAYTDLEELLVDIPNYKKEVITNNNHFYNQAEAIYRDTVFFVRAKAIDCKKIDEAKGYINNEFADATSTKIAGKWDASLLTSKFGFIKIGLPLGQVAIIIEGPQKFEKEIDEIVKGIANKTVNKLQ